MPSQTFCRWKCLKRGGVFVLALGRWLLLRNCGRRGGLSEGAGGAGHFGRGPRGENLYVNPALLALLGE